MIPPPAIYPVNASGAAELQRALRICMAGMNLPAALTCPRGGFEAWAVSFFLQKTAPHLVEVRRMAAEGDSAGIVAADAALKWPAAGIEAGVRLLGRREGARHWPLSRRFSAAVSAGQAAGHFATVMALQAAEFHIALLPLLQCVLYAEWHAARPVPADSAVFQTEAAAALAQLPSFISAASPAFLPAPDARAC